MTVFVPSKVPASLHKKVSTVVGDLDKFAKLHKVQDKQTKRPIAWNSSPMQKKIFDAVKAGHNRILIGKARQVYATTGCKMVLNQMSYATPYEAMHAVISMRADSATMLLDDYRRWIEDPPSVLKRPIASKAKTVIKYGDTGASVQAFTSRSVDGLRSFTPVAALISEAGYAPDLEEVIAAADAAVGEGLLMVESTVKNPADYFSSLLKGAPSNGWHLLTMYWWEHPAYRDEVIPDEFLPFEPTKEEEQLQVKLGTHLDHHQLSWRRRVRRRVGPNKFDREYPGCLEDCFRSREGGYYDESLMQNMTVMPNSQNKWTLIEEPHPNDAYVVGVDIAGGVGLDFSALAVVSVSTMQPVYFERCNRSTPAQWAHRVIQIASKYNTATVLAESNNMGAAFILEMNNCGYRKQWLNPKGKPWVTTLQSKLDAFDTLREALPVITVMDMHTHIELRGLTIMPGKFAPEAPKGAHDDCAMALALAYRALRDVPKIIREPRAGTVTRIKDLIDGARARRIRSKALPF